MILCWIKKLRKWSPRDSSYCLEVYTHEEPRKSVTTTTFGEKDCPVWHDKVAPGYEFTLLILDDGRWVFV